MRRSDVTGASRGIGVAVAERLAADSFAVAVNYSASPEPPTRLVERIAAAFAGLFDAVEAQFGGVDALVNNAGIMGLSPIAAAIDELFDRTVAVNLKGVFNGMREAARRLCDGGRVSFSSSVVRLYQPTYGLCAATKASVDAMIHILAKELCKRGITVNAIASGQVATELFLEGKSPELIERITKMNELGRLGAVKDIARGVAFLVGSDGGWINGQVLRADGGVI